MPFVTICRPDGVFVGTGSGVITVVSSDLAFGVARMFTLKTSQLELEARVFREMEPALEWIGEEL